MRVEPAPRMEPIPHWPGEFVSLGDYQVFVRRIPAEADITRSDNPEGRELGRGESEGAQSEPGLCVHGLAGSSRNWTDLMDELRPRVDCEALDLPGFGESPPRPDGRYSIEALADTVTTLIERRGRGPVHLIGNSLGGAVSLKAAARRPELVRALTLISAAAPRSRPR